MRKTSALVAIVLIVLTGLIRPSRAQQPAPGSTKAEEQTLHEVAGMLSGTTQLPRPAQGNAGVLVGKVKEPQALLRALDLSGLESLAAKLRNLRQPVARPGIAAPPGAAQLSFVSLSIAPLAATPPPGDVAIGAEQATGQKLCDSPDPFCQSFKRTFTIHHPSGGTFVAGETLTPDGVPHFAWFRVTRAGGITGWMSGKGTGYQFNKLMGDASNALFSVRPVVSVDRFPDDVRRPTPTGTSAAHTSTPQGGSGSAPPAAPADCDNPSQEQTISLAVEYTANARQEALNEGFDIIERVQAAEDISNLSLQSANINGKVAVVSLTQAAASEGDPGLADPFSPILDDLLSPTPQQWGDLIRARDTAKADIAIVVIENNNDRNCGRSADYRVDASRAFAVVNWRCIEDRFSFIHEIGHLVGLYHDAATRRTNDGVADSEVQPPYAQGFITTGTHPTASVMAYTQSCPAPCGRWPFWSDPTRTNQFGAPMGLANASFEVCVWRQRLTTVAKFHEVR